MDVDGEIWQLQELPEAQDLDSFGWGDGGSQVFQGIPWSSQSAPPHASPEGVEELPDIPRRLAPGAATSLRIQSHGMFLTYSQSALTRDQLVTWFSRQQRVRRLIIGQEHHLDGNVHWHVLVEYDHCKEIRRANHYDIVGEHPNIKIWRRANGGTYEQWLYDHWKYCKKEDPTPYIVGEEPMSGRKRKRDEAFTDAFDIARTESVNAGMQFLERCFPYELATKYDQIFRTLTAIRNSYLHVRTPARAVSDFPHAPLIVDSWRCLYINGSTGCGKTAYARALLPEATVVRHRDQLRDCDFSKGIIFDDFEVSHWPPTAVIHLLDWDEPSGIDVKHAHVVIPPKTRKIFTHNGSLERWLSKEASDEQVAACRRRITVVNIHRKLFDEPMN